MNQNQFEKRIRNQQWYDAGDEPREWWKKDNEGVMIEQGKALVKTGFSFEEALYFLGMCVAAVSAEYGE